MFLKSVNKVRQLLLDMSLFRQKCSNTFRLQFFCCQPGRAYPIGSLYKIHQYQKFKKSGLFVGISKHTHTFSKTASTFLAFVMPISTSSFRISRIFFAIPFKLIITLTTIHTKRFHSSKYRISSGSLKSCQQVSVLYLPRCFHHLEGMDMANGIFFTFAQMDTRTWPLISTDSFPFPPQDIICY